MIYIDPSNHKFFHVLAKFFQDTIFKNEETEITTDYTKQGTWLLTYASFVNRVHDILPKGSQYIAVQTENDAKFQKTGYREFLRDAIKVYEYGKNLHFGYSDVWRLEMEDAKDIDVLFYGAINKLRSEILDQIPNVVIAKDIYGTELQRMIMRSKIILTIHYYPDNDSAWDRVPSLVCNKVFTIIEKFGDQRVNDYWGQVLPIVDRKNIVHEVKHYLDNPLLRLNTVDRAFERMYKFHPSTATSWQDGVNKYR